MRFGSAKEVITPPFKMKLSCTGEDRFDYENIHDDVYVRAITFDDGASSALLISFDLLFHERSLNDALSEYAEQKYGVKRSAVCVGYTHAHITPAVKSYNPGHHDDGYEALLLERGKLCIDRAMTSMFEGYLEYGSMDIDLNISRRGYVDGKYMNLPNFNYPHDRELFVLCVKDTEGNVRSVMVNYACHPVFYPALLTLGAEFPGRLCELLDERYPNSTALFFQSAAGDVRPSTTVSKKEDGTYKWRKLSFDGIDEFAKMLYEKVEEILNCGDLNQGSLQISTDSFKVSLPMNPAPFEWFSEEYERQKMRPIGANCTNAHLIVNGGYDKLRDALDLYCGIIKLTDKLCIANVGGEPCYGIKAAVLKALAGYDVCFVGYTDDCAYIVDDKILAEGGYEAECHLEYGLIGPFKKGIDGRISQGFYESLKRLGLNKA